MDILDNREKIEALDLSNMRSTLRDFGKQFAYAWEEANKVIIPPIYKTAKNIIFVGMGGSGLGPDIIISLFQEKITCPVMIQQGYFLPLSANTQTLIIISSNSGNTEETLACAQQAKERGCFCLILTGGGKLASFATEHAYPAYIYDQKFNDTKQSRMSIGFIILPILAFLINGGFLLMNKSEIQTSFAQIELYGEMNEYLVPTAQNPAKTLSLALYKHFPIFIGGEFLKGTIHSIANQINENAKQLTAYFILPELNHHLLEGMGNEPNKNIFKFILLDSELYTARIHQRLELTKEIIEKNGFLTIYIAVEGRTTFEQACNLLQFGAYISFYMAILNGIDPSPIPLDEKMLEILAHPAT